METFMRYISHFKYLQLFLYLTSVLLSDKIPTNNLNSTTLNRWIVVKDDDLTSTKIEQLVANPITYISKSIEKKNVDLGSQKDTPIQAYQLFNNFNYNSSIVSFASIELSQKQEVGLSYFDYDMDASIYINGELVMSEKKGDINKFKVQLNKGKNAVIIVGDLIGGREPSFFAWFYGSQRGEIVGTIRDGGGKPVPFARVDIMGEKMNTSIIK